MSYVERTLIPNEQIVYRGRLTPFIFLDTVIFFLLFLMFRSGSSDVGHAIGAIMLLFAIITFISNLFRYRMSEFAVTTRRVVMKDGFIGRRSIEILLTKVEGIEVKQGLLEQLGSYGRLVVSGTGGTKQLFKWISKPFDFRAAIQKQIETQQVPASVVG